jgi:hypothetical protein
MRRRPTDKPSPAMDAAYETGPVADRDVPLARTRQGAADCLRPVRYSRALKEVLIIQ